MTAATMKRPLRNLGWLLGGRGVNAALSLVYLALATRSLGLADYGRFALIVVLAQAVAGLASFSTWQAVVRWGSLDGEAGAGETGRAVGFALALDLVSIAVGTAAAVALVWSAPLWLPLAPEHRLPAFGLCLACLLSIRSTPTGILRLHDRFDLGAAAEAALPLVRAVGAIVVAIAVPQIWAFVLVWGLAELACAVAFWRLALQLEPLRLQPLRLADIGLRALPARHPNVWSFVWATNFSRSLGVTTRQLLVLLVGALGGAALAGGYRVAAQLGQALVQLGEAVSRALYPELVRHGGSARRLVAGTLALALVTGTIAVTLAAFAGDWALVRIAGADFGFAHAAMIVLAAAGAAELLGATWDALLLSRGRAVAAFAARGLPLLLAGLVLPTAIAHSGLTGAAGCVLLASVLTAAALGYAARFGFAETARGTRR